MLTIRFYLILKENRDLKCRFLNFIVVYEIFIAAAPKVNENETSVQFLKII